MKEYVYYEAHEVIDALLSNREQTRQKALIAAIRWCKTYDLSVDASDIYQTLITKILEGERRIPKGYPLAVTLSNAIRGICSDLRQLKFEQHRKVTYPYEEFEESEFAVEQETDDEVESHWEKLLMLFSKDDEALKILEGTAAGIKKADIIAKAFNGDERAYDSTRRRIIRNGKQIRVENDNVQ